MKHMAKQPRTETAESAAMQDNRKPQRRCICCRGNGHKGTLLRFGLIQNTLCFDLRKKLPGRGFYVCATKQCLEKAFAGGFKRVTKRDPSDLADSLTAFVQTVLMPGLYKRYGEYLLAGFQSGQLICGADNVEEAAKSDDLGCYILATDASESTQKKYRTNAERKQIPCLGLYCASEYGQMFGKSDKTVLGWKSGRLLEEFIALETAIRRLSSEFEYTPPAP